MSETQNNTETKLDNSLNLPQSNDNSEPPMPKKRGRKPKQETQEVDPSILANTPFMVVIENRTPSDYVIVELGLFLEAGATAEAEVPNDDTFNMIELNIQQFHEMNGWDGETYGVLIQEKVEE